MVTGTARFVRWFSDPAVGAAVLDLTPAYRNMQRAARGVQLRRREGVILGQDEFTLPAPRDLTWGMTTAAEVQGENNCLALLTQEGKQLRVYPLAPAGARFEVSSAERPQPEAENRGFRRLLLPLQGVTGEQRIAVLFMPVTAAAADPSRVTVQPLEQWPGEPMESP